ncbi:MAG TPA: hypothetical protein VII06_29540 [Chloroflexota bacterium]
MAAARVNIVNPTNLGNPFTDKPIFSRNVWAMQAFGDRIYLGYGDFQDNTGPLPVRYLGTAIRQFGTDTIVGPSLGSCPAGPGKDYCLDEEQIYGFRVIDNLLYIPGTDSEESWLLGNFYTKSLADTSWVKHRTVPNGVHVLDVQKFRDPASVSGAAELFAGIGSDVPPMIRISTDDGQTTTNWRSPTITPDAQPPVDRVYRFFTLNGALYASAVSFDGGGQILLRYDSNSTFTRLPAATGNRMFPDQPDAAGNFAGWLRVFREVYVGNTIVYLGLGNDFAAPFGLYRAAAIDQAQRIALPVAEASPMDLLRATDGQVYVLGQSSAAGSYTNYVFASADLATWTEVLRFPATTFARSFAYLDGAFYFGMGTTRAEASTAAGDILVAANPLLPTATPTASATATRTPAPTATSTATPTSTASPTPTSTRTPTPTRTATPTGTAPAPGTPTTTSVATGPARVAVAVEPAGAGRLAATVAARPADCAPNNTLLELRFGDDPRQYRNAAIEIDGVVRRPPFSMALPTGTLSQRFVVVQLVAGGDATVPVVARDRCGEWSTLVGGGASAFQAPAAR